MEIKKMTKKFLLAVFSIALIGSVFTSCKDNTEDIMANVNSQTSELNDLLDQQKAAMEQLKGELQQQIEDNKDATDEEIQDLQDKIDQLQDAIDDLQDADDNLLDLINQNNQALLDAINAINALKLQVDGINSCDCTPYLWSDSLAHAYDSIAKYAAIAKQNEIDIKELQDKVPDAVSDALKDSIKAVRESAEELHQAAKNYANRATQMVKNEIDSVMSIKYEEIKITYEKVDSTLSEQLDSLKDEMIELEERVATNEEAITTLQNKVANLEDALAKMVTGIIVQGVENPIFGSFSLPVGLNSNILLGYYGENERDYAFPSNKGGMDATGIADAYRFISSLNTYDPSGDILFNDTLGTVYLTVNPAKTDFTGLTVGIENSIEESNGLSVTPLKESSKKLSFGYSPYTKSVSNGLYEAKVYLNDANSIDLVKINIESGLKSAIKDLLESFKTRSRQVDFTELTTAIVKQITNFADAYAINAEWTDSSGEHAVYSNYNLAATAFKPLSYEFLKGQSFGKLPVINEFDHIDLGEINLDLKLNFTPIDINSNVNIQIQDVNIDESSVNVTVEVPEVVGGAFTGNTISKKVEISNLIDEIEKQINSANMEVEAEIKKQLETQIESIETEINKYLKDMIADINGQLGNVDDLVDQFNGVEGKVNSAIDKVNSYVSRINNFTKKINNRLDNLNAYLQVTMLYETADGDFAQLSNSRAGASQIVAGKDAVLYPTSYTADIVVPAYKKYIAFTEVIGLSDSEQADKLSQLNTGDYLNTVLEGNTKAIKLNIPSSFSGKTLELTYSALDYSGYTSTRKFYIYVK